MAALTTNLDLKDFTITKTEETSQVILAYGNTTETSVDCRVCGHQTSHFHGADEQRQVQHLSVCGKLLFLVYQPRRYQCMECDLLQPTTTATPQFHYVKSQFTYEFERQLLLGMVNSTEVDVAKKYGVTEKEVQGIVDRQLAGKVDWSEFTTLGVIGIDEIAIKKGRNNYITVVTALVNGKVQILGVILGRKKQDIRKFLKSIPVIKVYPGQWTN